MLTEQIVVKSEGQTVDGILWQRYRWPVPGLLEETLRLNPGLAARGIVLPVGTVLLIPIVDPTEIVPEREVIQLWS